MIMAQPRQTSTAEQVKPAVSDVGVEKLVGENRDRSAGRSHAAQSGMIGGLLLNASVRGFETRQQQGLRRAIGHLGVGILNGLDGKATRLLPAFVSTHSVGNDGEPAFEAEFVVARRLPVRVAIFVVLALTAKVAERR